MLTLYDGHNMSTFALWPKLLYCHGVLMLYYIGTRCLLDHVVGTRYWHLCWCAHKILTITSGIRGVDTHCMDNKYWHRYVSRALPTLMVRKLTELREPELLRELEKLLSNCCTYLSCIKFVATHMPLRLPWVSIMKWCTRMRKCVSLNLSTCSGMFAHRYCNIIILCCLHCDVRRFERLSEYALSYLSLWIC